MGTLSPCASSPYARLRNRAPSPYAHLRISARAHLRLLHTRAPTPPCSMRSCAIRWLCICATRATCAATLPACHAHPRTRATVVSCASRKKKLPCATPFTPTQPCPPCAASLGCSSIAHVRNRDCFSPYVGVLSCAIPSRYTERKATMPFTQCRTLCATQVLRSPGGCTRVRIHVFGFVCPVRPPARNVVRSSLFWYLHFDQENAHNGYFPADDLAACYQLLYPLF